MQGVWAIGDRHPAHFARVRWRSESAQTEEGKMIKIECIRYMKKVRVEFGMGVSASFGVTFGLNEKGGMDMEEFAKYIRNAIMPLYPNVAPEFGK